MNSGATGSYFQIGSFSRHTQCAITNDIRYHNVISCIVLQKDDSACNDSAVMKYETNLDVALTYIGQSHWHTCKLITTGNVSRKLSHL